LFWTKGFETALLTHQKKSCGLGRPISIADLRKRFFLFEALIFLSRSRSE
jgi:hypothetical protein